MEIINALNAEEIGKLMNMGTDQINISELISIGKKIIPIIKKANGGKGLSKLTSMFTDDLDGKYALPYAHSVPSGLHPGISVYVQGTVLNNSKSDWMNFNVDFACGENQGGNIPLHFNPRFNAGNVVLNTFQAGRWGHAEGHQMPFRKGEDFEIIFIVSEAGYQILVNKKPFCTYKHRIPPQSVKFIKVKGNLELNSVNVTRGPTTQNMNLPYHHSVPGGLRPGTSVYVQGTVSKHSNSDWMNFNVDFACGENQGGDIPLHFNPRFTAGNVVLNTFQAGQWGHAEGHQMPFRKGEDFEIIFIVSEAGYQILVNKKPFCTYKHRIPPQSVKVIKVNGNLELNSLNVTSGPTAQNMALPYHRPVPGGFYPGKSVYVQGTVPQNSKRFEVNFACGQHDGANIAFQFKVYFNWQKTVLNTFQAGRWGHEEHHEIPFLKGEDFEVIFIVKEAKYQILVNRKPFCIYLHRIPPQSVKVINIKGQVELQSLNVKETENMTVPYTGNIPGGLGSNRTITVRGSIPMNAKRFQINLMAGQDIALHISLRMEQRTVVRNSFLYGRWGREERDLPFNPFQPGQFFELLIHCDNHKFKVYINGQPFFNFVHRYVPIEDICTIEIDGDVTLSYIKY
ncbi:galectin-9-like isoform 2-T2 [Vipera latastei]